jgi:GWxTD domain-containing protein
MLLAQPASRGGGARGEQQLPGFLMYEAISRAGEDSTQSRVDVPYRIDHEYFVPVKNDDSSVPWAFVRKGEVAVDLIDSTGVSRARAIQEIQIGQNSSERGTAQKQWYQGISSFLVPPGSYTVQIEVTDLESQRNVLENKEKVRAQAFAPAHFLMSSPVFVEGEPGVRFPDTLTLQNLGGDVFFGAPGSLFFELNPGSARDSAIRVAWTIKQIGKNREEAQPISRDSSARFMTLPHVLVQTLSADNTTRYLVKTDPASRRTGVLVPFPAEQLPLRMFDLDLTVTIGAFADHHTVTFRTVWPGMPFSLRDVDVALDALRFLVTPHDLDSLKDGSFEERRDHLESFWNKRNKTPGTAKNELMAEYYRRVDHAMRTFGTMRAPDGSRTDRGRVYIIFGPPTSMDRNLDPVAGFQETWTYEKQRKRFVFTDQNKSGNYVLTSTAGL